MTTHSSILAWEILCTEELGRLRSVRPQSRTWMSNRVHIRAVTVLLWLNFQKKSQLHRLPPFPYYPLGLNVGFFWPLYQNYSYKGHQWPPWLYIQWPFFQSSLYLISQKQSMLFIFLFFWKPSLPCLRWLHCLLDLLSLPLLLSLLY